MAADSDESVFDLPKALERVANDRQLFGELAAMLCDDIPEAFTRYRANAASGNWPEAKLAVHSLKGFYLQLEARRAAERALIAEDAARNGDDVDEKSVLNMASDVARGCEERRREFSL